MSFPTSNPYESPSGFVPKPGPAGDAPPMRYLDSFRYIFAHPEWMTSVLLLSVCALIPVLNQILLAGYAYEIVEHFHRFPGQLYPKFNFDRFSQYLMRGVWPFLVGLVVSMVVQLPLMCVIYGGFIAVVAGAGAAGEDGGGAIVGLGTCCMWVLIMGIIVAIQVILAPFLLRAGLSQDFAQGFKFNWAIDYLSKMWMEVVMAVLFVFAAGLVFLPVGLITCGIGYIFFAAVAAMAQAHLNWQIYTIYLARGGEPIPLKDWDGPAPMAPVGT